MGHSLDPPPPGPATERNRPGVSRLAVVSCWYRFRNSAEPFGRSGRLRSKALAAVRKMGRLILRVTNEYWFMAEGTVP
jgi:hypothetical protein